MKALHVAEGLNLPLELVTESFSVLAKKRMGKSYTARKIAEQLFKAGMQVCIVDPKGDWWGIRSAADGKSPGLSVLILGGEHGDVPLEVGSGELVAKLVVEERVSVLLDLSLFRKHEVATFMTAFAEAIYRLKALEKNRTPLMLIIDEADAIAPQKPEANEARMLGAIEDIVRRGGQRGIGCGLITQRAAVLNKNVLTQTQLMIALRTMSPQDQKAMKEWIKVHGTAEQLTTMMESLASLPKGDAWFWSPGWPTDEGIFQRAHVLPIETYDSGATPKSGEKRVEPKKRADVDLEALKASMAETIERAKATDPKALQAKVKELEAQVKKLQAAKVPAAKVEIKEVYVLKEGQLKRIEAVLERGQKLADSITVGLVELAMVLKPAMAPPARSFTPPTAPARPKAAIFAPPPRPPRAPAASHEPAGEVKINRGGREMMRALASFNAVGLTRRELGMHAVIGYQSGTFSDYLSAMRRAGYIDEDSGRIALTAEGLKVAGGEQSPRFAEELETLWGQGRITGGARRMLHALIEAQGVAMTRQQLGEAAGISHDSGTFSDYLSMLRRNGLIDEPGRGEIVAGPAFWLAAGRT